MRMRWTTQNEAADDDGFLLDGEASFVAELEFLAAAGCPDVHSAKFISLEVTGRDESVITAEVSADAARWLEDEIEGEPDEN